MIVDTRQYIYNAVAQIDEHDNPNSPKQEPKPRQQVESELQTTVDSCGDKDNPDVRMAMTP